MKISRDQYWMILDARLRKLDKRAEYGVLYLTKFFILKQRFEFLGLIPDRGVYWIADQAAILAITIKAVRKRILFFLPALVIVPVILVLLFRPDLVGTWSMVLALIALVLGALAIANKR